MSENEFAKDWDALTDQVIGLAIGVHRALGPGLLESAYEECLCFELKSHEIPFKRQMALPVSYKSVYLECGYRVDVVVADRLILELKTVEKILPIHEAQILTYLKLKRHSNRPTVEFLHDTSERRDQTDGSLLE